MDFPILWVGPAGSGKLAAARQLLGVSGAVEPTLRFLEIGDYSARFWEFPTHMEVDVLDLSMSDKQILPELLTQLLSTRNVIGARRKQMVLRRIHGLSPAAATRLRACLEELVWAPGAPAMIWCTARVVNAAVGAVMDGFVFRRCSGSSKLIGSDVIPVSGVATAQTYIAEMLRQMVIALETGGPCLAAAAWIRGRVYDLLGLMTTGADLVSGLTWAVVRMAATGGLSDASARAALSVLAQARWFPSYRTPLMLELIVASVYNAIATGSVAKKPDQSNGGGISESAVETLEVSGSSEASGGKNVGRRKKGDGAARSRRV